ncbi:MAG: hypothetical protein V3S01_01595 [Dehalococcoidia bacterium]
MTKLFRMGVASFLLLSGLASGAAVAQTDFSKFPLAKALPADVFVAVAVKGNPEREFLSRYWDGVIQEFLNQGILEDIWDLITDAVPDENLEEFEETRERFGELAKAVDWKNLLEKEMIYAGRFSALPMGEGLNNQTLLMGRMSKKQAEANYEGLKAILGEIEKLVTLHAGEGVVKLTETKEDGVAMAVFGLADYPGLGLTVAQWKDVLALSFVGDDILRDAMGLLRGTSKQTGLIDTPRFKKAFADLPAAEDSLVFFDIEGMISPMRSLFTGIAAAEAKKAEKAKKAEEDEGGEEVEGEEVDEEEADRDVWLGAVSSILSDLSIVDYMAVVEWTEGYRVFSESHTKLKPDAKKSPLYAVIAGNKPIKGFEKFVPQEAVSFSCSSGINLSKLYQYLIGFVTKHVPGGKETVAGFEAMQKEEWELEIDKDILKLFDGSMAWADMGNNWFLLAKVADEEKAAGLISRLLAAVNGMLGTENALMTTEVEVAGEKGFIQISHPMMLMLGGLRPPVVGCAEGYLIVGSSAKTVATCLDTSRGDHPNITKSKRWQKEALTPKSGSVDSISFTDQSNLGAEMQQMLGGLSMGLGMAGMFAQDLPPEVHKLLSTLPPLLVKLGAVAGKLDFYQSSASYSTFDGSRWQTYKVQNYKTPPPKAPPAVEEGVADDKASDQKKVGEI